MFPSNDLPTIINDNHSVPTESNNGKHRKKKSIFPKAISGHQHRTIYCLVLIIFIICITISIGLLSVFVPKQNNGLSVVPTAETISLTLVLSITQNTSYVLSSNNNSLMVNNYLNNAQRNILKACLQTRLNSASTTNFITVLSVYSAQAQYSGNNNNQTKKWQRKRRRRQTSSIADQVKFIASIQCSPLISKTDCQQLIESVLDNGEPLQCTLINEMITTLTSSPPSPTTTVKVFVAQTQHWRQVGQLFLAFGLTSLVGLERELRGKSAGLRTHSIVGTTSALILQVGKYGFSDVLYDGMVVLDPSRIAAQIVSGISFLGAGLIITRQKATRGLTTAASVWSAAAIGMAAGAGLWVISLAVTGLHFIILLGFLPLEKRLPLFDKNSSFRGEGNEDDDKDNGSDSDTQSV